MQKKAYVRIGIFILLMVVTAAATSFGQDATVDTSAVTVADYTFCKGVEERDPVGSASTFAPDTDKIYLWTEINAVYPPSAIKHVWYYGETKMTEVPLRIGYERTRTWSYKTILEDWVGEWHVDIVNENGELLKRVTFTVGE